MKAIHMKNRFAILTSAAVAILVTSAIILAPVLAAPKKYSPTSYGTWDADMINSDATGCTGAGVYVAVLDTGLTPNWKDYFPEDRVATELGKGFFEPARVDPKTGEIVYAGFVKQTSWIGSVSDTHGTHVTSTILGYNYYDPYDAAVGFNVEPIFVEGIAPDVTIIPVRVLTTYHMPGYTGPAGVNFGTDLAVAAGIRYAADLSDEYSPMIITMSLGGDEPSQVIEDAIDYALTKGVVVVASAGNDGDAGMGWPGAYPQVISVGACGWEYEWWWPGLGSGPTTPSYLYPNGRYRLWWLQKDHGFGVRDVAEAPLLSDDVYIPDWSSRENDLRVPGYDQDLDVVAPGSWVRGPYPGLPGYSHLPWWSKGWGWLAGANPGNFYYVGGTSMAAPHVTGVVAMMLEKNPTLTASEIEDILETTALSVPTPGSMPVYDYGADGWDWYTYSWGGDATGAGLVQADTAVTAS